MTTAATATTTSATAAADEHTAEAEPRPPWRLPPRPPRDPRRRRSRRQSAPTGPAAPRPLAETERITAVRLCAGGHGDLEARAIRDGWDLTRTELEILRALPPAGARECTRAPPA